MANNQVVTTAVFKAEERGVDETVASLNKLDAAAGKASAGAASFGKNTAAAFAEVERAQKRSEAALNKSMAGMATPGIVKQIDQSTKAFAQIERQANNVRKAIDPVYRDLTKFEDAQKKLNAAAEAGAISWQKHGELVEAARTKFVGAHKELRQVSENLQLASHQMANLRSQGIDIATMYFGGASIGQIAATQSGQIYEALAGQNGIKAGLSELAGSARNAFSSVVSYMGPVGLGIAGIVTATAGLWYAFRDNVKPIDDLIKQQEASVKALAQAYDIASSSVEQFGRKSAASAQADASQSREETIRRQMSDAGSVLRDIPVFEAYSQAGGFKQFDALVEILKDFKSTVDANAPAFGTLNDELATLRENTDDKDIKRFADEIRATIAPNVELQNTLRANVEISDAVSRSALRMGEAYRSAMSGLASFAPDLRTQAEKINDAFLAASANAKSAQEQALASLAAQKAMAPIVDDAQAKLAEEQRNRTLIGLGEEGRAVAEVNQRYDEYIRQAKGSTDAIVALEQARAQAIDNVGSQAAFDREQEANKEREAAAKRATDEAQRYAEATRSRIAGIDQTVASQRLELDMFGQTEGASAALRFEFQALTAAKQAAAAAGGVVSEEELAKIREASAEVGRLTEQLAAKNAARSAVDQFFPFEAASREAERLGAYIADVGNGLSDLDRQALQMQIDRGFVDAASAAENLRTRGVKAGEDIGRSFIENVGDVFADIFSSATRDGESFFSSILRGFAGLGSQLAAAGAKNLFGKLFGFGTDQSAAGVGGIGAIGGGYSPPVAANSNYNVGAVTSAPLMALNDNLAKTSRSALDVAKQFAGLNERADSKVLNSFLQASGNWKGLSTADTAWCAAFANASIMQAGGKGTGSNLASSFLNWGTATNQPKIGDVVVLRPQARGASGHVGFVAGFGDGTVQIFGGNQSASAKVSNFSTREVVGYRTGPGTQTASSSMPYGFDQRALQRATSTGVKDGLTDYSRQASYGDYTRAGVDPWNSGGQNLRQAGGGFGQTAFGVLGAGAGIFSSAYQGGDPLMGGVSGALGGFQAGSALFPALGAAGPIGAIAGAAIGLIGGALGKRKQRQEAHKQAAAQWEQMRPAYEAFDASLSGEGKGDLRKYITDQWGQLSQFMSVGGAAWKMGTGNSTAQFNSTGTKLFEGFLKMLSEFQEGFDSMVSDMASGQGLQGAFAKGRAATKDLASQLKKTRDDIDIAFGNIASIDFLNTPAAQQQAQETERQRADAIARYNDAAGKYALSLLYTAEKVSDVQQTIDGLRGTAAGLVPIFKDLGWNADEAARVIDERLNAAIANIARGLEQNLADRIDELSGRSYLTSVRSFLEEYEGLQRDFSAAGADASRLPEFFKLQAQSIVDGAELTGDAFAELVRLFPQLNGVVSEFVEKTTEAKQTAKELAQTNLDTARDVLERSYQAETDRINDLLNARRDEANELESTISKLEDFAAQLAEFKRSLLVDDSLSTLAPEARLAEARKQFLDLAAKARAGDADAQSQLTGAGQEYLTEARSFYASTERYHDAFEEVRRTLDQSESWARGQLTTAESQLAALKQQITQNEALLEANRKEYEAILGLNEGIKSLEVAFREYAAAAAAARAAGITVPGAGGGGSSSGGANYDAPRVPGINVSTESAKYLANNPDVAAAIKAGQTFGLPAGMAPEVYASAHFGLHGQTEGRGWATGGYTGAGGVHDVAGLVHKGEVVWSQRDVAAWGGAGTVDMMRQTRSLPMVATPMMPRVSNDNANVVAAIERLTRTSTENAKAIGNILSSLSEDERRENREVSSETERRRESSSRIAARRAQIAA